MTRNSRVELYAAIRRDARAGLSGREIQRKHGVGWRTVQSALASAWPQQRAAYPTRASKLDGFKPAIDDILRSDLNAPRKQRHTVTRIVDRLRTEFGMDDVSYPVVRAYVAKRRPEISIECGRGAPGVFVPQTHLPGREAEVDFGEIGVRLRGQLTTCHLFSLRMSYSGKAVHRASATGGQEAFFEGHVHAFQILGGVPAGKIRYDNLKAAVAQVIGFSRQRVETDRWVAFRSHFDIDAFYCQPGITGAHEKGGVEGDIGRFRRNHLVPVPEVESLHELNELIDGYDQADDRRRIGHRAHTVAESFNAERQLLKPLPVETFETGLWVTPRVDRYSQITVRDFPPSEPTSPKPLTPPPANSSPTAPSSPNYSWPNVTTVPADAPNAASAPRPSHAKSPFALSTTPQTRTSTPPSSTPWPPQTGYAKANPSALSATPERAKATCSSPWEPKPPWQDSG